MENLKKQYIDAMSGITDAPRIFIEGSYYFVLSSVVGKFFVCPAYPKSADNPMRPNIWIILSGKSGVLRKSTVINYSVNVIKKAWLHYYRSKLSHLTDDVIRQMVTEMFIESGSPEGLADYISDAQKDRDIFIIVSHEFGAILQQMKNKDYMTGFGSFLSKLFSGEETNWKGAKKTRYIKPGLYVTAIFGMQEPWIYLDSTIFRQGLMRRPILIYAKPEDKERWLPPIDPARIEKYEVLDDLGRELGSLILEYENMSPIIVDFTPEARQLTNEYARYFEENYATDETNFSYYAEMLWDHMVRISILEAITNHKPKDIGTSYRLLIGREDVEEAVRFISSTLPRAREAIVRTEVPIVKRPIVMDTGALELIYQIIRDSGEHGISASELLRKTRILKDELKKYIVQLMEEEKIIAVVKRRSRGRPHLRFFDKSYENKVAMIGDILSVNAIKEKW